MSSVQPFRPSLASNPDLDTWIRIERDGTVIVSTGRVEIGQGILSVVARIAAEELDVRLDQVKVHGADTGEGPDEGMTAGSTSVEVTGHAMRLAAAEARQVMLEAAAERLGAPLSQLQVEGGVVRARGSSRSVSYGELQGGRPFDRKITGEATPKAPETYRIVGKPAPRIDMRAKLTGGAFVQDLRLPGMLFGRVVRPPGHGARLQSADLAAVRALPGVVEVVRDGDYLGVIAEREEQAVRARELLRDTAQWSAPDPLPADRDLFEWLLEQPRESYPVIDGAAEEGPVEPYVEPPNARVTLHERYARPFIMHASMGPCAAAAQLRDGQLTIWTAAQAITWIREGLATVLDLPPESIRLIHSDGAGCYGHNSADDAALDAALLARAVPGRPVHLQLMREDEHCWEPYGPAMVVDLRASLDATGRVMDWSHDGYSLTHVGRPWPGEAECRLLGGWHLDPPFERVAPPARLGPEIGIHRNANPGYAFPRKRITKNLVRTRAFRTSALRGLGAYVNVFAIESMMDELAYAAGADPLAFRLAHLEDPRARAVLEAAAEAIGWPGTSEAGRGIGIAYARYAGAKGYAAVGVELGVEASGAIHLERAVVAGDVGQVMDPQGVATQLEGGFVQAASWTLLEEVRFDSTRIRSVDWETYPILGFADVPEVQSVLIDRPGAPTLGAGEASTGPTPAAIANAVFRATGRRLRRTPFTPERVAATEPSRD